MDDILLIYVSTRTNLDNILQYIGIIHSSFQLNSTMEFTNIVNFLELSITRRHTCLGISIFHKPASTSTTINVLSSHPLEHKLSAYRFLIGRMFSLPLDKEQQDKEWEHILHTAHSNEIPLNPANPVKTQDTTEQILAQTPHPPTPPIKT